MGGIGSVLQERYELIAEIGKGGMSTVYLAKDLNLDSYWAVKKVKNEQSVAFAAFKKEVELLSSLNHPDIPRIVDRIEQGEDYYVVMDFVDGTSLGKKVLLEGPQSEEDILTWGIMLCDILQYLHTVHQYPIVYCDMKPENVMLSQVGRTKLIDFGIAKECQPRVKQTDIVGTRGYAAPEQYKGGSNLLDERTDIYALGATLYNLATGITPTPPPQGVGSIRKVNPNLSEGLDYVISRATQQDPNLRYANCLEMKADLQNIPHLTTQYRKKMTKNTVLFFSSVALSAVLLFTSFQGYKGIQADSEDKYQVAFTKATEYDRQADYTNASIYYAQAIDYKPSDYETYLFLLRSLLPQNTEQEDVAGTKTAIDEMRKRYIENSTSPMYQNPNLMYQIVRYCIQVDDPVYAQYAVDYINLIRDSKEYKDNAINVQDIDNYAIIASYGAEDISNRDFEPFQKALTELEKSTDESTDTIDTKLENYYTIIKMYSTYPTSLTNSYTEIYELGGKVKNLIDTADNLEDVEFNSLVPLYEIVAVSQYNSASLQTETYGKEEEFKKSIEWYSYLDDLSVNLPLDLAVKKANAYKGVFDLYYTPSTLYSIDDEKISYLNTSINLYNQILERDPTYFAAQVFLTQAYLEKEFVKPEEERDYSNATASYERAVALKDESGSDISILLLSQFSSLKQQMVNALLIQPDDDITIGNGTNVATEQETTSEAEVA